MSPLLPLASTFLTLLACAPREPGTGGPPAGDEAAVTAREDAPMLLHHPRPFELRGPRTAVALELPPVALERLVTGTGRLGLYLDGVRGATGGAYFEVYGELPEAAEPDPASRHYLGNLTVFSPRDAGSTTLALDASTLRGLLAATAAPPRKLTLTFVRRGLEPPEGRPDPARGQPTSTPITVQGLRLVQEP